MIKQIKKGCLAAMLILVLVTLCACHENPSQEQLYSKLLAHFENRGLVCELQLLEQEREAPIYKASAWKKLMLNGEEVLVYFDDSNRADYLSSFVDEEVFGSVWHFGLRFVMVYNGSNSEVLDALNAIEN